LGQVENRAGLLVQLMPIEPVAWLVSDQTLVVLNLLLMAADRAGAGFAQGVSLAMVRLPPRRPAVRYCAERSTQRSASVPLDWQKIYSASTSHTWRSQTPLLAVGWLIAQSIFLRWRDHIHRGVMLPRLLGCFALHLWPADSKVGC
jgi:hypothetical protein